LSVHSVKIRAGHLKTLLNPIACDRYVQLQKFSQSALLVLDCFKSSPKKCLIASDIEKDTGMPRLRTADPDPKRIYLEIGTKSRNPLSTDFLIFVED
jgi:hypothetical protein